MNEKGETTTPAIPETSPWAPPVTGETNEAWTPPELLSPQEDNVSNAEKNSASEVGSDYTEVPPMFKHAEVPKIGGPGSEQASAMMKAAADDVMSQEPQKI